METFFSENFHQLIATNPAFAFIAVFIAGILVGFTPCVYPLIPVTLGFIGAKSTGGRWRGFRLSAIYVFGMALTYACLGAFASLTGRLFGQINSHPITYFLVSNVFLLMGLSMLGVFEFPQISFSFKKGTPGKPTGAFGVWVVGLISGLILGPCTAPVLGALLVYVGTKQNILYGFSLLFVFGYGIGFLLMVLGTFTGLLTSIPRSGVWLERIKQAFGWILVLSAEALLIKTGGLL